MKDLRKLFTENAEQFDALMVEMLGENTKLKNALTGLVEVKYHKDMHGKDEWYADAQPVAWQQAIEALKT